MLKYSSLHGFVWPFCVNVRSAQRIEIEKQPAAPSASITRTTPATKANPPSCAEKTCQAGQTCVLRQYLCIIFCHPAPVCVPDACIGTACPAGYSCRTIEVPGSSPTCGNFPSCRYQPACVPIAEPKPGFCPLSRSTDPIVHACNRHNVDSDCPSNTICCRTADGKGRCTAPIADPCEGRCSGDSSSTCVIRNGTPECREEPRCVPDSFACVKRRQVYCSDEARLVVTRKCCRSSER